MLQSFAVHVGSSQFVAVFSNGTESLMFAMWFTSRRHEFASSLPFFDVRCGLLRLFALNKSMRGSMRFRSVRFGSFSERFVLVCFIRFVSLLAIRFDSRSAGSIRLVRFGFTAILE